MNHWIKAGLLDNKSLEYIRDAICYFTGISIDDLKEKGRKGDIPVIRQLYCYVCCNKTNHSLTEIGSIINRDHATVCYSRKAIMDKISVNESKVMNLLKKIEPIMSIK